MKLSRPRYSGGGRLGPAASAWPALAAFSPATASAPTARSAPTRTWPLPRSGCRVTAGTHSQVGKEGAICVQSNQIESKYRPQYGNKPYLASAAGAANPSPQRNGQREAFRHERSPSGRSRPDESLDLLRRSMRPRWRHVLGPSWRPTRRLPSTSTIRQSTSEKGPPSVTSDHGNLLSRLQRARRCCG